MTPASLKAFRAKIAAQQESLFACTLLIGSAVPPGLPAATGGVQTGAELTEGGLVNVHRIVFAVRRELLADMPKAGQRVTWVERATDFRIETVGDNGDIDPTLRLQCVGLTS